MIDKGICIGRSVGLIAGTPAGYPCLLSMTPEQRSIVTYLYANTDTGGSLSITSLTRENESGVHGQGKAVDFSVDRDGSGDFPASTRGRIYKTFLELVSRWPSRGGLTIGLPGPAGQVGPGRGAYPHIHVDLGPPRQPVIELDYQPNSPGQTRTAVFVPGSALDQRLKAYYLAEDASIAETACGIFMLGGLAAGLYFGWDMEDLKKPALYGAAGAILGKMICNAIM